MIEYLCWHNSRLLISNSPTLEPRLVFPDKNNLQIFRICLIHRRHLCSENGRTFYQFRFVQEIIVFHTFLFELLADLRTRVRTAYFITFILYYCTTIKQYTNF